MNLSRLFTSAILTLVAGLLAGFILIPLGKSIHTPWLMSFGNILMWLLVAAGIFLLIFWAFRIAREDETQD